MPFRPILERFCLYDFLYLLRHRLLLEWINMCFKLYAASVINSSTFLYFLRFGLLLEWILMYFFLFIGILVGWQRVRSHYDSASVINSSVIFPMSVWIYLEWIGVPADVFKLSIRNVLGRVLMRVKLYAASITYSYSSSTSTATSSAAIILFHVSFVPLLEWICVCEHRQ